MTSNTKTNLVTPLPLTPTPTAKLIAELQGQEVSLVEAALVAVRGACSSGDFEAVQAMLLEQAALLQALGMKLIRLAGYDHRQKQAPVFVNLALRALELSRKSLSTLHSQRNEHAGQTNVQVNVTTNELLGGANGERVVS